MSRFPVTDNNITNYNVQYTNEFHPQSNRSNLPKNFPMLPNNDINKHLSVSNEKNIKYTENINFISISSNNRNSTNYPLHYDYRINFDTPYKNVKSIEMISAIIPNQSATDILNEPYLVVDIDELNCIEFPNVSIKSRGFAILPLKAATKGTGGFINPELGCIFRTANILKNPIANLSHMTIKIRDMDGNLYDFGQSNGSTAKAYQNAFVFKITTEETDTSSLQRRNVF